MARIKTYPVVSDPTLDDLLIGTDRSNLDKTKNFGIGDIGALFANLPEGWPGTLQQVTDLGATTTAPVSLLGGGNLIAGSLTISGNLSLLSGTVTDSAGSPGAFGQLLQSNGIGNGVSWVDTSLINPTLQDVTTNGNFTETFTSFNGGLSTSGYTEVSGVLNIASEVQASANAGNPGDIFTSSGIGAIPTWQPLSAINDTSLGVANQNIPSATARVVSINELSSLNFLAVGSASVFFNSFNQFYANAEGAIIDTRTGNSPSNSALISTDSLQLKTNLIFSGQGANGMTLRLVDPISGDCEWSPIVLPGDVPVVDNTIISYENGGTTVSETTIIDNGVSTGFGTGPKPYTQIDIETTLGTGITSTNGGTLNPGYGSVGVHTGLSSNPKIGSLGSSYAGTAGSAQLGSVGLGGASVVAPPRLISLADTQVGILGVGGGGIEGQAKYGGYFVAETVTADDNIGVYSEVSNTGTGDAYAIQLKDGTEGLGKLLVSDAFGRGSWQTAGVGVGIDDVLAIGQLLTTTRTIDKNGNTFFITGDGTYSINNTTSGELSVNGTGGNIFLTANDGVDEAKIGLNQEGSITLWTGEGANSYFKIKDSTGSYGTAGQVLVSDGGGAITGNVTWQSVSLYGPSIRDWGVGGNTITAPTTLYSIERKTAIGVSGDKIVLPDPATLTVGQIIVIKDASGTCSAIKTLEVTDNIGGTIDGSVSVFMNKPYQTLTLLCVGATEYEII